MGAMTRALDLTRSGPYFAGLFLVALVAFWPSYLSQAFSASAYTHLHAFTAALWIVLLGAQPTAIRARRLALHRLLGRTSYALAPLVLLTVVLLAHSRITSLSGDAFARQTYFLYLQVSLGTLFGLAYALAIVKRRPTALHARFMVCTALPLIDPVVVRLMLWANPTPSWNYQWFTFGLTDLVIVALLLLDRRSRAGRMVFSSALMVFVLAQIPALFGLTDSLPWQGFARWFAALPLT